MLRRKQAVSINSGTDVYAFTPALNGPQHHPRRRSSVVPHPGPFQGSFQELMGTEALVESLCVEVEDPVVVKPAEPTKECTLFLSNIDQVLAYYVETVYFYETSPDNVAELLRDALSKLLVPYYFMAGRFRTNAETGKLELNCNGEGVLFASARCDLRISDLGDISVPNPAFRKLVLQPNVSKISEAPLVTLQVTKFSCGGVALGLCMSHASVDGVGALEFLSNLCSICRGSGLQVVPQPDRTMLKARSPPRLSFEHPEYIKLSDLIAAQKTAFTAADTVEFAGVQAPTMHIYRSFPFTPDRIARLKQLACEDGRVKKCSTFEAVVAHIWQARTRSVAMDPDSPSKLFFAVDIRNRVVPPLPKAFAGNGVISAPCVTTLAKEVREKPLSFCVQKVQEGIANVTDEYVRSSIDHGELYRGVPALFGGIFISPWWRIPFQKLDFGWGKPLYAGPVINDKVEFVLLLHNCKDDGGLNAYLALEPAEMEKFEKNLEAV